jgi:hypothetical protein
MSIEQRAKLSRILILIGILWTVAVACAACGDIDAVFTTVEAVIAGIGPVLAVVGGILSPAASAAIGDAVKIVGAAVAALKTAVDDYITDSTGDTTLISKIEAGITALQQSLNSLLAAAHIDNATLQSWIAALVNAVSACITTVVNAVMPAVQSGALKLDAATQDEAKATAKTAREELIASVDAATLTSKLPAEAISKYHDGFHKAIGHHVGPIHF